MAVGLAFGLLATVLALALLPSAAGARTCVLKNKRTHFKAKAPCNFKLKYSKKTGAYTIYNKRVGAVVYTLTETDASPATAGAALVEQLGVTVLKKSESAKRYLVTAKNEKNGAQGTILVRKRGKNLATAIYNALGKSTSSKASIAANAQRVVERIANRATGGRAVPLPVNQVQVSEALLPTQKYTTPDGLGTANTIVGWTSGGTGGAVETVNFPGVAGYDAANGTGEARFGIAAINCYPNSGLPDYICRITSEYLQVPQAVPLLGPIDALIGAEMSNVQATQCNPTDPIPGYDSTGICSFTFTRGGAGWIGVGLFATSVTAYEGTWLMYYSYISVPQADPRAGATLRKVWESWDPSAGVAKRLQDIQNTMNQIANLIAGRGVIDQRVFDKTSENWDRYIRGQDPDLTPLSYAGGPLDRPG